MPPFSSARFCVFVDPHAWMMTAPIVMVLVSLHFQPDDHLLKRLSRDLMRLDAEISRQFGWSGRSRDPDRLPAWKQGLYWMSVGGLLGGSVLSFCAWLDVLPY